MYTVEFAIDVLKEAIKERGNEDLEKLELHNALKILKDYSNYKKNLRGDD